MELKKPRMQAVFTDRSPGWLGWLGWWVVGWKVGKVGDVFFLKRETYGCLGFLLFFLLLSWCFDVCDDLPENQSKRLRAMTGRKKGDENKWFDEKTTFEALASFLVYTTLWHFICSKNSYTEPLVTNTYRRVFPNLRFWGVRLPVDLDFYATWAAWVVE